MGYSHVYLWVHGYHLQSRKVKEAQRSREDRHVDGLENGRFGGASAPGGEKKTFAEEGTARSQKRQSVVLVVRVVFSVVA